MKTAKQIISIILIFTMAMSMLAFSAIAVEKVDLAQEAYNQNLSDDCFYSFSARKIKSIHIPIFDKRITKINPNAVAKVYHFPDESIKVVDMDIEIPAGTHELLTKYWASPEEYVAQGKVEYVGQVNASNMYFGENDYRPMGNFPNSEKYNSVHIDLRSLDITKDYGDYAVIFEEGSFTSEDGSVISERVVIDEFFNLYGSFNAIMKMTYIMYIFFCVFNFKFVFKGY